MKWLLLSAILPGVIIIILIYRRDWVEKEPKGLIIKLLLLGVLSVVPALILEVLADKFLAGVTLEPGEEIALIAVENFLGVGLVEELCKYFMLKQTTWKHRAFNYRYDGIVYAVTVSMGFAIHENIWYVMDNGFTNAIVRAVLSVPGHASFAVCMGIYYAAAKMAECDGDYKLCKKYLRRAIWMPTLIHGFFDFCLSVEHWAAMIVFFVFVIIMDVKTIKKVKKYSKEDVQLRADVLQNSGELAYVPWNTVDF